MIGYFWILFLLIVNLYFCDSFRYFDTAHVLTGKQQLFSKKGSTKAIKKTITNTPKNVPQNDDQPDRNTSLDISISQSLLQKMEEERLNNPSFDLESAQKSLEEYGKQVTERPNSTKGFSSSSTKRKITKEEWFEQYERIKREQELTPRPKGKKSLAFGEKVLERFSPTTLKLVDNALIAATFLSLSTVIGIGVGLSVASLKVPNSDFQLDPEFVKLINDVLYPAFTPAIAVLFLCSITFGLFKFAQVSSNKTVYTED